MNFSEMMIEDRRFLILRALYSSSNYQASSNLLQSFLDSFGQKVSGDLLRADLAWLEEHGLLTNEKLSTITLVNLQSKGEEVATGRTKYPGIRRPRIGELS